MFALLLNSVFPLLRERVDLLQHRNARGSAIEQPQGIKRLNGEPLTLTTKQQ
jgi:hypothetical protein